MSWKWFQGKATYSLRTFRRTETMKLRMVFAILRTRLRKHLNIVWKVFSAQNIQSERAVLRDKAGAVCQSVLSETWFNSRLALSACCQGNAILSYWHLTLSVICSSLSVPCHQRYLLHFQNNTTQPFVTTYKLETGIRNRFLTFAVKLWTLSFVNRKVFNPLKQREQMVGCVGPRPIVFMWIRL